MTVEFAFRSEVVLCGALPVLVPCCFAALLDLDRYLFLR